jgi:hypothetical protein
MPRYLAMMPLEFCGQRYKQNDYIETADEPSAAERAEIARLNQARALRESPAVQPTPGASRDRAMEAEPSRQRGYKTRAGGSR